MSTWAKLYQSSKKHFDIRKDYEATRDYDLIVTWKQLLSLRVQVDYTKITVWITRDKNQSSRF